MNDSFLNDPNTGTDTPQFSGVTLLFSQMINDMKFVGMFIIIYGALTSLSIIGALIGVPLIFVGVRIREAAEFFQVYQMTKDRTALLNAFDSQAKYFRIAKILIIISIILIIGYFVLIFSFLSYLFNQVPYYENMTQLF